jgi:cyclic-di-GMP-binding protein
MAHDDSFDVVSKVDMQEFHNGLQQAQKEIANRFDFRGSSAGVTYDGTPPVVKVTGDDAMQVKSVIDVFETKLAKRGVSMKALAWKNAEQLPSGKMKQESTLQQGISTEKAREIVKSIQGLKLKKVQARIDGDSVRVSGKQRDDLQMVIQHLKSTNFTVPLQFENYR